MCEVVVIDGIAITVIGDQVDPKCGDTNHSGAQSGQLWGGFAIWSCG